MVGLCWGVQRKRQDPRFASRSTVVSVWRDVFSRRLGSRILLSAICDNLVSM